MGENKENLLGVYLKDRRTKLDPAVFGFPMARRRTAGLRREEVAQRANLSTTWYTWLEQGRGGAPSAEVLERLADALLLTEVEREHLFFLALGHPPAMRPHIEEVLPARVQNVMEAMQLCPAMVRNSMWDVIGWNKAADLVLGPYKTGDEKNILRKIFSHPPCSPDKHWENFVRFAVGTFRAETLKNAIDVREFVTELSDKSPVFKALWQENDVRSFAGGTKLYPHPKVGPIEFEYSAFGVQGQPDLTMVVYHPVAEPDREKVRMLVNGSSPIILEPASTSHS